MKKSTQEFSFIVKETSYEEIQKFLQSITSPFSSKFKLNACGQFNIIFIDFEILQLEEEKMNPSVYPLSVIKIRVSKDFAKNNMKFLVTTEYDSPEITKIFELLKLAIPKYPTI